MLLNFSQQSPGVDTLRCATVSLMLGLSLLASSPTLAETQVATVQCGAPTKGHDYRPSKFKSNATFPSYHSLLDVVEKHHFTPEVEALVRAKSGYIGGDLSYTLNAFPNHHRALISMIALGEKEKTNKPSHSDYSVECWFRRAIAFGPDDLIVRMIFARYLAKANRPTEAEDQLGFVASQAGDNAFTHNNIGLIYFDWKNYDKALVHAHMAYELGLGIPTLRDQLKKIGKWKESVEVLPSEPSNDPMNPVSKSPIATQE